MKEQKFDDWNFFFMNIPKPVYKCECQSIKLEATQEGDIGQLICENKKLMKLVEELRLQVSSLDMQLIQAAERIKDWTRKLD